MLRFNGKTAGFTDCTYTPPDKSKRLRSKQELKFYCQKNNLPNSILSKFDYRNMFCVCLTAEDKSPNYIECSYGLAGCRRWIHTHCVGLGRLSDVEISKLGKVVCPFCTAFLEGAGLAIEHKDKRWVFDYSKSFNV
jgi:hypothetical protein